MAVITQDTVLFGGTLKRNMDPFSQYTDQELWTALGEVQLKTLVEGLPGQLQFKLRESGTNLSVGERQLVCLARALVQKSKIIIMDEATANVDFKTDRLIQEVIRDKFKDSTVITIAHRLNTIMDYDKVLVLDGGRVVEIDKPDVLMRKGGLFAEMIRNQNQSTVQKIERGKVTQDLTGQTPYFIFNPAMNRTFASKGRSPWRSSVKNVIYRSNLVTVFSCSLSEQDDVTEVLFRKKDTKFVLDHFSGILSFLVYVKV